VERTLLCEIVTPEEIVYKNEVRMVVVPTIDGEVGILPLHAPLVTVLAPGEIRVRYSEDEVEWFAVADGYMQVHEDKVIVLASQAKSASQIDVERARQACELIEKDLAELSSEEQAEQERLERDLRWQEVQAEVGRREG
jgi:F-type H+-transporting ATPase subunit epsilon